MTCSDSSMRCKPHPGTTKRQGLKWPAAIAFVAATLAVLALAVAGIPATVSLPADQAPAAKNALGRPITLNVLANAVSPPSAGDWRLSLPECLDAEWPPRWRWRGFSWRGFAWEAQLTLWAHAPGNTREAALTFLPTGAVLPLPELAFTLPEQPPQPTWTPSPAPAGYRGGHARPRLDTRALLLFALTVAALATALTRQVWTWRTGAPARIILTQLSRRTPTPSADAIQTAVHVFFTRRPGATEATPDLHSLANVLARGRNQDALLAPVVRHLAEALDTARFAPPQPPSTLHLEHCRRLACHIIRTCQRQT